MPLWSTCKRCIFNWLWLADLGRLLKYVKILIINENPGGQIAVLTGMKTKNAPAQDTRGAYGSQ